MSNPKKTPKDYTLADLQQIAHHYEVSATFADGMKEQDDAAKFRGVAKRARAEITRRMEDAMKVFAGPPNQD